LLAGIDKKKKSPRITKLAHVIYAIRYRALPLREASPLQDEQASTDVPVFEVKDD
jgi:hypothetical protein